MKLSEVTSDPDLMRIIELLRGKMVAAWPQALTGHQFNKAWDRDDVPWIVGVAHVDNDGMQKTSWVPYQGGRNPVNITEIAVCPNRSTAIAVMRLVHSFVTAQS